MPAITERRAAAPAGTSRWRRLGWFVLLYAAGLAATLLLAYGLRALIPGM